MPAPFVGLHLALAIVVALFGLSFLLDPCGGGGDLCLGGIVGLSALGAAGIILAGLALWRVARRASPLLVLDSVVTGIAWPIVAQGSDVRVPFALLGAQLVLVLGALGAAAAGRAIVKHRVETALTLAVLAGVAAFVRFMELEIIGTGVAALVVGWVLGRRSPPPVVASAPHGEDREE